MLIPLGPSPWVCALRVRVPPPPPCFITLAELHFFFFLTLPGKTGVEEVCVLGWGVGRGEGDTFPVPHDREEEENLPCGPPGNTAE